MKGGLGNLGDAAEKMRKRREAKEAAAAAVSSAAAPPASAAAAPPPAATGAGGTRPAFLGSISSGAASESAASAAASAVASPPPPPAAEPKTAFQLAREAVGGVIKPSAGATSSAAPASASVLRAAPVVLEDLPVFAADQPWIQEKKEVDYTAKPEDTQKRYYLNPSYGAYADPKLGEIESKIVAEKMPALETNLQDLRQAIINSEISAQTAQASIDKIKYIVLYSGSNPGMLSLRDGTIKVLIEHSVMESPTIKEAKGRLDEAYAVTAGIKREQEKPRANRAALDQSLKGATAQEKTLKTQFNELVKRERDAFYGDATRVSSARDRIISETIGLFSGLRGSNGLYRAYQYFEDLKSKIDLVSENSKKYGLIDMAETASGVKSDMVDVSSVVDQVPNLKRVAALTKDVDFYEYAHEILSRGGASPEGITAAISAIDTVTADFKSHLELKQKRDLWQSFIREKGRADGEYGKYVLTKPSKSGERITVIAVKSGEDWNPGLEIIDPARFEKLAPAIAAEKAAKEAAAASQAAVASQAEEGRKAKAAAEAKILELTKGVTPEQLQALLAGGAVPGVAAAASLAAPADPAATTEGKRIAMLGALGAIGVMMESVRKKKEKQILELTRDMTPEQLKALLSGGAVPGAAAAAPPAAPADPAATTEGKLGAMLGAMVGSVRKKKEKEILEIVRREGISGDQLGDIISERERADSSESFVSARSSSSFSEPAQAPTDTAPVAPAPTDTVPVFISESEYQDGVRWYNAVLSKAMAHGKNHDLIVSELTKEISALKGVAVNALDGEDGKQIEALAGKILSRQAHFRAGRSEGWHNPLKTLGLIASTPEDYFKKLHGDAWKKLVSAPAVQSAAAAAAAVASAAPVRAPALVAPAPARPPVAGTRLPASAPARLPVAGTRLPAPVLVAPARVPETLESASTTMSSPSSGRGRSDSMGSADSSATGRSRSGSESSSDSDSSVDSSYSFESTGRKSELAYAKAAASRKRSEALGKIKGDAKAIAAAVKSVTEQYKLDREAAKRDFGRVHKSSGGKPPSKPKKGRG